MREEQDGDPKPEDWRLERQRESLLTLRRATMALLAYSFFCLLTLGQSDRVVFENDFAIVIPFADVPISFNAFYIVGPILLVALWLYLQIFLAEFRRSDVEASEPRVAVLGAMRGLLPASLAWAIRNALMPAVLFVFAFKGHYLPDPAPRLLFLAALGGSLWAAYFELRHCWTKPAWRVWRLVYGVLLLAAPAAALVFALLPDLARQSFPLNLRQAHLPGRVFDGMNFAHADLVGANFVLRSEGGRAPSQFIGANLRYADLRSAMLQGADLRQVKLQGAILYRTNLMGVELSQAALHGVNLTQAQLQGATLLSAELQGADLIQAQLQGAILSSSNLQGADLFAARLQGADLSGADLQGATLRLAAVQGANFGNAILDLADLSDLSFESLPAQEWAEIREIIETGPLKNALHFLGHDLQHGALERIAAAEAGKKAIFPAGDGHGWRVLAAEPPSSDGQIWPLRDLYDPDLTLSAYDNALASFLATLPCEASSSDTAKTAFERKHIALGIAYRAWSARNLDRPLGPLLAQALLESDDGDCQEAIAAGLALMRERDRRTLEELAGRDPDAQP